MDLESQMAFTTKRRTPAPDVSTPDLLAEMLFNFNPAFLYQWVEDYSKSGQDDTLSTIPHLTNYWNNVFHNAGVSEGAGLFTPTMSKQHWLDTFQQHALPLLRNNRKLFSHVNHH